MPIYGLYFVKNNRLEQWRDVLASHDLAAIEVAQACQGEHSVELWYERRKITTFAPDEPSGQPSGLNPTSDSLPMFFK